MQENRWMLGLTTLKLKTSVFIRTEKRMILELLQSSYLKNDEDICQKNRMGLDPHQDLFKLGGKTQFKKRLSEGVALYQCISREGEKYDGTIKRSALTKVLHSEDFELPPVNVKVMILFKPLIKFCILPLNIKLKLKNEIKSNRISFLIT